MLSPHYSAVHRRFGTFKRNNIEESTWSLRELAPGPRRVAVSVHIMTMKKLLCYWCKGTIVVLIDFAVHPWWPQNVMERERQSGEDHYTLCIQALSEFFPLLGLQPWRLRHLLIFLQTHHKAFSQDSTGNTQILTTSSVVNQQTWPHCMLWLLPFHVASSFTLLLLPCIYHHIHKTPQSWVGLIQAFTPELSYIQFKEHNISSVLFSHCVRQFMGISSERPEFCSVAWCNSYLQCSCLFPFI